MAHPPDALTAADARALIDRLLSIPDSISITDHCRTRGQQRRFDQFDIWHVLEHGLPSAEEWDDKHQEWKYKIAGTDIDGDSLTLVIVLDIQNQAIKIITGHG